MTEQALVQHKLRFPNNVSIGTDHPDIYSISPSAYINNTLALVAVNPLLMYQLSKHIITLQLHILMVNIGT